MAGKGHLFEAAKILERAAHEKSVPNLSELGVDARSFVGAAIDYLGFDRVTMNGIFGEGVSTANETTTAGSKEPKKSLFDDGDMK